MTFSGMGVTGGAHRLWSHRSYKAKVPMRILLMLMQSAAHQVWHILINLLTPRSPRFSFEPRSLMIDKKWQIFVTLQNSIYQWVRDHRCHHKYTDTDADPHNSERGFFFSHMGWLIVKKHPEVLKYRRGIDMSDIENDPVVSFQRK